MTTTAQARLAVGVYYPTPKFRAIPAMVCVHRDDEAREVVATFGPAGDPESEADAHSFAAVPDLLAACKLMLVSMDACTDPELWHHTKDAREAMHAAIAKAEPGS